MTTTPSPATTSRAFLDARLEQMRLVKEEVTAAPSQFAKEPVQVQIRAETSSGFTLGLNDLKTPKNLTIEISYKVVLKLQDSEKQLVAYEAGHQLQFGVSGWTGFDNWQDPPHKALAPYTAIAQCLAMKRAQETLGAMGFGGIILPKPQFPELEGTAEVIQSNAPAQATH